MCYIRLNVSASVAQEFDKLYPLVNKMKMFLPQENVLAYMHEKLSVDISHQRDKILQNAMRVKVKLLGHLKN